MQNMNMKEAMEAFSASYGKMKSLQKAGKVAKKSGYKNETSSPDSSSDDKLSHVDLFQYDTDNSKPKHSDSLNKPKR